LGFSNWRTAVIDALASVLDSGQVRTRDLGGTASTTEVGQAVCDQLLAHRND
jgi:isocitrate/isopropylmalate dehydrogenase